MRTGNRKSTPRVIAGRVQKKNNWELSEDYYAAPRQREVVIDRKRPGDGYRHVLTKKDIYDFLEILPDWDNLAVGLNAIVLAPGEKYTDGYHTRGVVAVCAWEAPLWRIVGPKYYADHKDIFARLGVDCELVSDYLARHAHERTYAADFQAAFGRYAANGYLSKFTAEAVRAYQLLHILLHELGHHHDRMTTKSKRRASRGESYAEAYARQYEAQIWQQYLQTFALY